MAFLARVKKNFAFFSDSWSELKKVRWPHRKELWSYTLVVISTVAFITIYFALLDLGISWLLRLVYK